MSERIMSNSRGGSLGSTRTLTTLAMLTCIGFVVTYLSKFLPSVSGFLDFDFKSVVLCIGGFIYGPVAAAAMGIVSSFVEMFTISHTGIIGLIMNILATTSFCCTASFVYKKKHTMTGAVLGLGLGLICLTAVMLLWNYLITPLYMTGVSRDEVVGMLVPVILPFNLVKGGLNMAATLLLYKPIVTALRKASMVPPSSSAEPARRTSAGFVLFSVALLATFIAFALVLWGII